MASTRSLPGSACKDRLDRDVLVLEPVPTTTIATSARTTGSTAAQALVAVCPPDALRARAKLFEALAATLPVSFEGQEPHATGGADAAVVFASPERLRSPGTGQPCLVLHEAGRSASVGQAHVAFGASDLLDRRLRSARLREVGATRPRPLALDPADSVLAEADGVPVWASRMSGEVRFDTSAVAPPELRPGEHLRDLLGRTRFLSLLPLVHFLRGVAAGRGWAPPPLRAAFLFDDPNLSWTTYGHIAYRELAAHARRHGYHVAVAMVPASGRFVHPGAARIFRENPAALSVVMHGNDHVRRELARRRSSAGHDRVLAQALRRIAAFERRSGLTVGRVMVPPHGACSEPVLRRMLAFDLEAVCMSDPPAPAPGDDLPALRPVDLVAGGMPVIPRVPIGRADDEIALRAFLDQPLVVYGHHADVASGLEVLEAAAARVNSLGAVRWCSPVEIGRSNYESRREGRLMEVRVMSRRAAVQVPADVDAIRVQMPGATSESAQAVLRWATASRPLRLLAGGWSAEAVPVEGGQTVTVQLASRQPVDPYRLRSRRPPAWGLARRTLAQGRDRAAPLVQRARAAARSPERAG
jgi:hypothetical protein